MAGQEFDRLAAGGLLFEVEQIVVEGHRRLHEAKGLPWTKPVAYRWLRFEDPAPVERLAAGVRRLRRRGASFDAEAVDKACAKASISGYLN
jgi:hypothetical protein